MGWVNAAIYSLQRVAVGVGPVFKEILVFVDYLVNEWMDSDCIKD